MVKGTASSQFEGLYCLLVEVQIPVSNTRQLASVQQPPVPCGPPPTATPTRIVVSRERRHGRDMETSCIHGDDTRLLRGSVHSLLDVMPHVSFHLLFHLILHYWWIVSQHNPNKQQKWAAMAVWAWRSQSPTS